MRKSSSSEVDEEGTSDGINVAETRDRLFGASPRGHRDSASGKLKPGAGAIQRRMDRKLAKNNGEKLASDGARTETTETDVKTAPGVGSENVAASGKVRPGADGIQRRMDRKLAKKNAEKVGSDYARTETETETKAASELGSEKLAAAPEVVPVEEPPPPPSGRGRGSNAEVTPQDIKAPDSGLEKVAAAPEVVPVEEPPLPSPCDRGRASNAAKTAPEAIEVLPDVNGGMRSAEVVHVGALYIPGPGMINNNASNLAATPTGGGDIEEAASSELHAHNHIVTAAHVVGGQGRSQSQRLRDHLQSLAANAPVVEGEIAVDDRGDEERKGSSRRRKLLVAGTVVLVAVLAGILAGTLIPRGGDGGVTAPPKGTNKGPSRIGPKEGNGVTETPKDADMGPSRVDVITEAVSGTDRFVGSSPQSMAREWLVSNDTYLRSSNLTNAEISQRYILALLYFALGGENWKQSRGFLGDTSVCDGWFGVQQCKTHPDEGVQLVSELRLDDNGLSGILPEEVTYLPMLEVLDLKARFDTDNETSTGKITGTIPSNISALGHLKELSLSFNNISGPLPSSIGRLTNLTELSLIGNPLKGTIPSEIGNLAALERLSLGWGDISGTIPSTIGRLRSLEWLSISRCDVQGTLPSEIGNLAKLENLYMYENNLTGPIPFNLFIICPQTIILWTDFKCEEDDREGERERERESPECDVKYPELIGDGYCDGGSYNRYVCSYDGGDCEPPYPDCVVQYPGRIGDGRCDGGEYNTEACGWDGEDCETFNKEHPDCDVAYPGDIGDGYCDGGEYNTAVCGFDGGDCELFNQLSDCHVDDPWRIGDGECRGGDYNTEVCSWDGGDCIAFNEQYPDCHVDDPSWIEDGECDGGDYNTEGCGWDGGDCATFNKHPDCHVDDPSYIGDGECDGGDYNMEACGWDGGDCETFNKEYPDCKVDDPSVIGDGLCDDDWEGYNTEACGWDGGDCPPNP